eukprot:CAMPEP_0173396584 /NCGR_PEP_ID=MMETSP1356-20130122/35905_1 /TAXON_ID=77927 ORGANISM="Hemiselmis virescens, Strain PCC157" /NCGR_SAMPLE_ID=MMETSP1356 /ASSEMBLY_ACC=CAM_ASM_000847 /LENGTH=191 /DNA_ID=CAMNT_0014355649 /DNA_START=262 /DNA_END=834 /DNA_ORIENTATION=+
MLAIQAPHENLYDWLNGIAPNLQEGRNTFLAQCAPKDIEGGSAAVKIKARFVDASPIRPLRSGKTSPVPWKRSLSGGEKRCASCEAVGDAATSTCQICGENFSLDSSTRYRESASSPRMVFTPRSLARRRLFEKEDPVPLEQVEREPMVWESTKMKIRLADGSSRDVVLPMLVNPTAMASSHADDEAKGRW